MNRFVVGERVKLNITKLTYDGYYGFVESCIYPGATYIVTGIRHNPYSTYRNTIYEIEYTSGGACIQLTIRYGDLIKVGVDLPQNLLTKLNLLNGVADDTPINTFTSTTARVNSSRFAY